MKINWDRIGVLISALCAVHCVVSPFLILIAPFYFYSLEHPVVHILFAAFVVPVGLVSFIRGYQQHQQFKVLALGLFGLGLILLTAVIPHQALHKMGHTQITLLASASLIVAHILNRRSCECHPRKSV